MVFQGSQGPTKRNEMGLREPQPPKLIKGLRSPRRFYRLRRVAATHPSAATVPSLLALLGHRTVVADPSQSPIPITLTNVAEEIP